MALRPAPLLLLVLGMVTLRESCVGVSSHSLKYFYTAITEPSQGQPHFVVVGFVDGQLFSYYDSHSRRMEPRVSWTEKVGKEDPQYWERNTQRARGTEEGFRESLETLRNRYNQSEGLHTLQRMYGCELRRDGSKGGFMQYGYEGRTFITFDKETLTWVTPNPQAQITQRKWDAIPGWNQRNKAYLEEECIEWLEKHLSYGKETLLRTETPKVTVRSRTEVEDGMETYICRVDGFYPREIDAFWTRDGEVWLQDTFHGFLAPNADGTYHYWLSIQIDPKERDHYRCHVEHDSLQDPLDLELKEPTDSKSKIIIITFIPICVFLTIFLTNRLYKIFQDYYKKAPNHQLPRRMNGYELCKDRSKGDFHHFRYNGRTFITFDTETHTWVALNPLAKITRRKWEVDSGMNQRKKSYLEKICIECLETYLSCGKETLLRTETPKVTVSSRMEVEDGMETHVGCPASFYSWKRDEKACLQDILCGSVAPNVDGTYHYWLSIRIDPKERNCYWCHVEHDELPEHLEVSLKEEKVDTPSIKRKE